MRTLTYETYLDKVYGCFVGKAISGNMGAPHEGQKMPMELPFMPEMINPDMPNDDLDLQVLWLDVVEKKGADFTSRDLLERFVKYCPYSPGEYAVMRKNFNRGIYPPYSGKFCNDYYTEGMGCPIRSEVWACLAVGNPRLAADFAVRDGQQDHNGESIQAERFLAAAEAEAFFESDVRKLIDGALDVCRTLSGACRLYIVTNGIKSVQTRRFSASALKDFFSGVFISEEIGFEKPHRSYFEAVARQIEGFAPQSTLIIGDSLSSDILGGINAGLSTCWFNPEGKKAPEGLTIDFEIAALHELLPLVL